MEHAIKIAAAIVERLPRDTCSPETTEGKEGFLHPIGISGALEKATLSLIVRDFTEAGLKEKEALLDGIVRDVMKGFPRSTYRLEIKPQYRNMKEVIDRHPEIVDHAVEAIRRAGLKPVTSSIRGGTDGSRLSFMGLPCPNIFAGEHAFHSRLEWVSVQDMEKADADHRPSGDDLGGAGLRLAMSKTSDAGRRVHIRGVVAHEAPRTGQPKATSPSQYCLRCRHPVPRLASVICFVRQPRPS